MHWFYFLMTIPEPTCKGSFLSLAIFILLISPTHAWETELPLISFDEIHGGIPVVPASPPVVAIVDRPPYSQSPPHAAQGGDFQTQSPMRIDGKDTGQQSLTKNEEGGQEIGSQLVWIVIIVCSIVIIGGTALLLIKRLRNKDKARMRLHEQIQKHIELQEKSQAFSQGFPSQ